MIVESSTMGLNSHLEASDDEDEPIFQSVRNKESSPPTQTKPQESSQRPSLDPYIGKLERFELFSTNQCYYLVACDKHNMSYRVMKMDRTLIERPLDEVEGLNHQRSAPPEQTGSQNSEFNAAALEAAHTAKPTLRPLSDFLAEDPHTYSQGEIQDMLDMIHHGNRYTRSDGNGDDREGGGGLKPLCKGYGILGFIRFLDCYYLTLITRRAKVGSIGGNGIYTVKNTDTFPLKPAERIHSGGRDGDLHTDPSSMLLNMWNRGKRSVGLGLTNREIAELRYQGLYQVVDFTKNFYFSYTYDLTRSLQENFLATTSQPFPPPPFKDMYAWNFFLTRELEESTNSLTSYYWVMPVIHGAFIQRKLNDYGRILNMCLVARRSRHFAGTRYLKRGVSEQGKCANDVEHEQVLHDESGSVVGGVFSSYLQVRGSIPTYWTQESSVTMPKPPIELNRVDPTYRATQVHFEDLFKRYGSPIIVLDLVKQSEKREREVRVGNEFRHAIDYMNTSIDEAHQIRYCALDYSHISKHRNLDVSTSLNEVSTWSVNQTGFFCSTPQWKIVDGGNIVPFNDKDKEAASFLTQQLGVPVFPMEQCGVLRTNCIDCLDRTNVAQFSAGVEALEQQLVVMGIRSSAKLDPSSTIIRVLIEMFVDCGDIISLQYGGSEAHKKVSAERTESSIPGPIGKHKELLTSIRRYYSNAFTDRLKQDAMNLLLGYYIPYRHTIPLWEMETDYYLHNLHVKIGRGTMPSMKTYQRAFGVDWSDDEEEPQPDKEYSTTPLTPTAARRAKLERIRSIRRGTSNSRKDNANPKDVQESDLQETWRISQVRRRCNSQNEALGVWWKVAIQSNMQQRMWMQLGNNPSEFMLPPRFERAYQPDKLAQFDRFFARAWATPVRRSHSASVGTDHESELSDFRKSISGRIPSSNYIDEDEQNDSKSATRPGDLASFTEMFGYKPAIDPSLTRFLDFHQPKISTTVDRRYVGSLASEEKPDDAYVRYVAPTSGISSTGFRQEAYEEFKRCLHDTSLNSDNVAGIRKLAESAYIGSTIRSGPYKGLSEHSSAVEATTVLHEQLNALESMRAVGHLEKGYPMVTEELRRRGYSTAGMKEAVANGWAKQEAAEQQYMELLDTSNIGCRRSDLTTEESMRLYTSYFDDATSLSTLDVTFIVGSNPPGSKSKAKEGLVNDREKIFTTQPMKTEFVVKAAKMGYSIPSQSEIVKAKSPPLFTWNEPRKTPNGFEQINEDLFARKDNKFMVFNGAGVNSWQGTEPKTKVASLPSISLDQCSSHALLDTVNAAFNVNFNSIKYN